MRKEYQKQMSIMITTVDHPHAEELERIGRVLGRNLIIYEMALQDVTLNAGGLAPELLFKELHGKKDWHRMEYGYHQAEP